MTRVLSLLIWPVMAVLFAVLLWNDYVSDATNRNLAAHLEIMQERIERLENTMIWRIENVK